MTEPKPPVPGLKSLVESVFGIQVDEDMKRRIEQKFGTSYDDDPSRWADVKRSLAVDAGEDPEAEGIVDRVVERLRAELAGGDAALPSWTLDERAIFATRAVEVALEEGGPEGLRDEAGGWVDDAVEGYRHLGLREHAEVTSRIRGALDGPLSEDEIDDLMEDWFNVPNADGARATWIRDHPEGFRT